MGNHLTMDHATADLVDLSLGVGHIAIQLHHLPGEHPRSGEHRRSGSPRTFQITLGLFQVQPVRLFDCFVLGRARAFVPRGGMLHLLDRAVLLLELPHVVGMLTPPRHVMFLTELGTARNGLADRVIQQVDIGREMDIRLHHKGITAPR
jgi:hypothetical protein